MEMTHPGLPLAWTLGSAALMLTAIVSLFFRKPASQKNPKVIAVKPQSPLAGFMQRAPALLLGVRIGFVFVFLLLVVAGLFGTPYAERNAATVLTWNLWWTGLILSVLLVGTAWCAVCPWDTIAHWLVRRRLWRRADPNLGLRLKLPRYLNNIWPALLLLIVLTWLELGLGVTLDPYVTAVLALCMVVLATMSLSLFDRKAFCRHLCPVGRTVGMYSQLSIVELRPIDSSVCSNCSTLECYHGNSEVDGCPTGLVMGRLKQNSYCLSCGNCVRSCPDENVAWRLRSPSIEAISGARPRWDEACFMLGLLVLTAFHGVTMMPFWEQWMSVLARSIDDSGRLLWSFTIGLSFHAVVVVGLYAIAITLTSKALGGVDFKRCFSALSFSALPLAFSYHMAHNLNHLLRESDQFWSVLSNPMGIAALPLTMAEKHQRHVDMWFSDDLLHASQSLLMLAGFVIAVQIILSRGSALVADGASIQGRLGLVPMLVFAILITLLQMWMLSQPMTMRM